MVATLTIYLTLGLWYTGSSQETDLGGVDVEHRYACVSAESCGPSNMYSIECSMGEKIAMLGVSYGAKPYTSLCPGSSQACMSKSKCCTHEEGDCLVPYGARDLFDLYGKCSQGQQCGWLFSKSIDLDDSCKARRRSNYVMADFYCVSDNQFVDVCSQHTVTARTVHMHHSAIPPSVYNYQQCSCLITPANCNTTARLMFRAVDVRLQSRENWTTCDPNSRVELIGQQGMKVYRCEEGRFLHGLEDFHISQETNVALYLYKEARNYPTKLWMEVRASEPGVDVKVTCGPRSVQTAKLCPALPVDPSQTVDKVLEVPDRPDNNPTVIQIDVNDSDPDNPHTDGDEPQEKKNPAIAAILGGVAAGIVVLILLLVLVCLILRRKKNRKKEGRYSYKACKDIKEETHQVNYYETVADPDKIEPATTPGQARVAVRHPIYHQPWGTEEGFSVNRAKPSDLAYATSEEIKVLIEKMEKDRQCITEGENDYPAPNPTYYRHIDTYRYRYSGPQESDADLLEDKELEQETKSNASGNSGTDHMGSEDSKVEADRHMDSDSESHKEESETQVQTYWDGYESPRLSTFHPVAAPKRNSLGVRRPVTKPPAPPQTITDDKSDDVPAEIAPPSPVAKADNPMETGEITVANYREPDNAKGVGNQLRLQTRNSEYNQYSPVYDEIKEIVSDV